MASLKDIRSRIETTKNTQQITKAMKLVSASKLRKAQHQIVNMRPYAKSLLKVIADIAVTRRVSHPLLETHEVEKKKILLVVVTSDRGLCGSFNTGIIRCAEEVYGNLKATCEVVDLFLVGRKAIEYFQRKGVVSKESATRLDKDVSYELAAQVADKLMKAYLEGEYDEVRFVYNEFKSAISQKITEETILPVDISQMNFETEIKIPTFSVDMLFEPSPEKIIDELLVKHFSVQVYRCMCESVAAEHGARMTAMENASNNAKEVLAKLTLTYNKVRQEKITTELIEIVSGAQAL